MIFRPEFRNCSCTCPSRVWWGIGNHVSVLGGVGTRASFAVSTNAPPQCRFRLMLTSSENPSAFHGLGTVCRATCVTGRITALRRRSACGRGEDAACLAAALRRLATVAVEIRPIVALPHLEIAVAFGARDARHAPHHDLLPWHEFHHCQLPKNDPGQLPGRGLGLVGLSRQGPRQETSWGQHLG
jgi:hypothetical protein